MGDGGEEGQEDAYDVPQQHGDEGIREDGQPLHGQDDLGGEEPHAAGGRELPRAHEVRRHRVEVPGLHPGGAGGPGAPC